MRRPIHLVLIGLLAGLLAAALVWYAERTTGQIAWPLIVSFPVSWGTAGYLLSKWRIL